MNDAWYADDSPYPTADFLCGGKSAETLPGAASASCLASQIRELFGEDCELDARFLEESWASGLPATAASYRRRRDQAAQDDDAVTFGELNTVGGFIFSQAGGLVGDRPACICPADSTKSYTAAWLHDPIGDFPTRSQDQAPVHDAAGTKRQACGAVTLDPMTYQRACELLSVREESTVTQIRAAYRRMVGEWHPDRLEQSGETVRAFATKQMAAINEAYHLLRSPSYAPAC